MGQEAECTGRMGQARARGKARLEHDTISFRSADFRVRIPLKELQRVEASNGDLELASPRGGLRLELGPKAEDWARRITSPPSLLDKLGIKAGMRVSLVGLSDEGFVRQLRERTEDIAFARPHAQSDAIFCGAERREALARLATLQRSLKPNGAIWVVRPKGQKTITEADVMAAGKRAGLVDVKVVSFSATHTAEKFVIPIRRRKGAARRG